MSKIYSCNSLGRKILLLNISENNLLYNLDILYFSQFASKYFILDSKTNKILSSKIKSR